MTRLRSAVLTLLAAFCLAVPLSAAPAQAWSLTCGAPCQLAWQQQRADALPRTAFYDPPAPLRWGPLGQLIRQQAVSVYQVRGKTVTATRIMYHSRTSTGRDIAATGVLLVPSGTPPASGWPVVVDAHGSSGIGRDCAPSLMRDLYHGDQMLGFVDQGWAVIAPDYAGLGTTGRVEFLNTAAEGSDVIGALRAAQQTGAGLSRRWVLWGHSQGGGAALSVAQRQLLQPEPGYLGTVVTSPAADLVQAVSNLAASPGLGGFLPLVVRGAAESDPRIKPGQLLTAQATQRLQVTWAGCLGVVIAVYSDLTGPSLVRPGYLDDPQFAGYLVRNSTGTQAVAGPVLLLQGDADAVIPVSATSRVASSLCHADVTVDYRTYPGLGHDTIPGQITGIDDGAMPDILSWITDRFAGRSAPSTCNP